MKKLSKVLALVLVLAFALSMFAGCGTDGKYYLVVDGEKSEDLWIEIDGEEWADSTGLSGTVVADGKEITLKSKAVLGISMDLMKGEKSGGTITFDVLGEEIVYKK